MGVTDGVVDAGALGDVGAGAAGAGADAGMAPAASSSSHSPFEIFRKNRKKNRFFIFVQFAILFGTNPAKGNFFTQFQAKIASKFSEPLQQASRPATGDTLHTALGAPNF